MQDDESQDSELKPDEDEDDEGRELVESPDELLRAEARVSGQSPRQWRRMLGLAGPRTGGTWFGGALLVAVILVWLWITYDR